MSRGKVDFKKSEVAAADIDFDLAEIGFDADRGKVDMDRVDVYACHVKPDSKGEDVVAADLGLPA